MTLPGSVTVPLVVELIDPERPVRWGIASTGRIAAAFTQGLARLPDAEVVAVASRAQETADRFGDAHGIAVRHASYEAMAAEVDVDVVYVGTPHSRHCADTLLFLDGGKHVLCEKPFAINEQQVAAMIEAARARGSWSMVRSGSGRRSIPNTGCSRPPSAGARCSTSGCTRCSSH